MNRFSMQPIVYASIDDLRRALLIQIRRFNKACAEVSARAIPARTVTLTGGPVSESRPSGSSSKLAKKGDADLERLELLRAQINLLNNMLGNLMTSFATEEKAKDLFNQIEELRDDIRERWVELQRAIHDEVKGNISTVVKRRIRDLQQEMIADLKLQPNQVPVSFCISSICLPNSSDIIPAEVACIRAVNLKDSEGNQQPNYFITLAFPIEHLVYQKDNDAPKPAKNLSPMYISVSPNYKIPAKVVWDYPARNTQQGKLSTSADLQKVVKAILERDGILGVSEKREIPIDTKRIKFNHPNILGNHVVKGNVIEIKVKNKSKEAFDETVQAVLLQMKSMINAVNKRNKDGIRFKPLPEQGIIRIIFTLPGRMKGRLLSDQEIVDAKRVLHMTDDEVKRWKTAIEDHED